MLDLPSILVTLVALCAVTSATEDPTVTTAPIYLPGYNKESWSLVRGSVIASQPESYKTTYTIFCPDSNPPTCDLSLEFPFILVQGPDSIQFHGTHTSTLTANLECTLHGSKEATCSGYSSYKEGYNNGAYDGALETSWTSTFTGTDVEWGILTMAGMPHDDDSWDITATWATPTGVSDYTAMTDGADAENAGWRPKGDAREAVFAAVVCVLSVGWLL